jgi:surfeit locus 1 family protein
VRAGAFVTGDPPGVGSVSPDRTATDPRGSAADYSFVRRPVWIVGHLVVLVAVVGFAMLGLWQLERHRDRAALDTRLEDRLVAAAVPIEELTPAMSADPSGVEYRPVVAVGEYLVGDEVILQARSLAGVSGHEVLTPLLLADGTAVVVDRGWVPIDAVGPPVTGATPPSGEVTVTGFLRRTQERASLGPFDPAEGRLERLSRVDVARLGEQIDTPLLPMWMHLTEQTPEQTTPLPRRIPPPEPGDGPPHLSYAVQWWVFAAVVAIGYPVLLNRTARRRPTRRTEDPVLTAR